MEAKRIGSDVVYMRPLPGSRRRLWLVRKIGVMGQEQPYDRGFAPWKWRIRTYKTAAHL